MRRRSLAIAFAVPGLVVGPGLAGWSCKRSRESVPPAPPAASARFGSVATGELIVGSERGLEAWRRDGKGKRLISQGQALFPRWLVSRLHDDAALLVLRKSGPHLDGGGWLEKIALADGKRTVVAQLPPFACATSKTEGQTDQPRVLDPWEPDDFYIDFKHEVAWLTLTDQNHELVVDVWIDLGTGKVSRWLSVGQNRCAVPAGVTAGEPPRKQQVAPDANKSWLQDDAKWTGADTTPVLREHGVLTRYGCEFESMSPSGTWVVLGCRRHGADRRGLLLLDRTTGDLFTIRQKAGSWPAALPRSPAVPDKPARQLSEPAKNTIIVVDGAYTVWLGDSSESELFVIDDLVLRPGGDSFSFDGQLAR